MMVAHHGEAPTFVQNRCFARMGWDRDVRAFCRENNIRYQGFSLLTANPEVVQSALVRGIADQLKATPAQVVFRFAQAIGMLPLTGTTDVAHMKQDLAAPELPLSEDQIQSVESLS